MKLTEQEKHRYSRHLLLNEVGNQGQLKLKKSKVLIIGAGGLGCPILMYLAAAGVGNIGIIDFDNIEESNLQRQILFTVNDIGSNKAICAKRNLEKQNPHINISAFDKRLDNNNALELFSKYDIIVDGTDNFSTRYLVNDACVLTNKPLVYGAIHKFEGQVSVFNLNNGPTYRCLFPTPPPPESVPSCSEAGVIGVLPGLIGTQQANEVLKLILEIGEPLSGKISVFNALNASTFVFKLQKSKNSNAIKKVNEFIEFDYSLFCDIHQPKFKEISKEKFASLPTDTIVLDVRESWENPKIKNKTVINIPLNKLDSGHKLDNLPKDKNVYVVCQKGARSLAAIGKLENEFKYNNLINVKGGVL